MGLPCVSAAANASHAAGEMAESWVVMTGTVAGTACRATAHAFPPDRRP
jgi:hypothetical protein